MTDQPARLFADFIREQANGRTHDELTTALADIALAVRETGKKGSITLTIAINPMKGMTGAVQITDAIKVSKPSKDRPAPVFFVTESGRVQRDDPLQPTFEGLREVPAPATAEATQQMKEAK